MRSTIQYLFLFLLLTTLSACDGITSFNKSGKLIYSNGFNTEEDVKPLGELAVFSSEAPSGGGNGSAFIAGGCVVPHSTQNLVATKAGSLKLSAWGKEVYIVGGIELKNLRTEQSIMVIISGTEWKQIESEAELEVIKGDKLELWMSSGGFVAGGMLVTQVDVAFAD